MRERGLAASAIVAIIVVLAVVVGGVGYFLIARQPGGQQGGGPGGGAETMGIPVYPDSTEYSIPSDLKTDLGISASATCDGYCASADPASVTGWYKENMSGWTLISENSFSPPDRPGMTVYTQHYKKGDDGAFIFAHAVPMGQTVFGIVAGSWSSVQGCGVTGGGENQPVGEIATQKMKNIGANYVGVIHWIEITPDGTILPEARSSKQETISYIEHAHSQGLKVLLSLYPEWYDPMSGTEYPHAGEIERGPVPNPEEFLENLTQVVLEFAGMAENYGVEMYSPVCELNVFLAGGGVFPVLSPEEWSANWENAVLRESYRAVWEKVKEWHYESFPKIREVYSGYLVPKGEIAWSKYYLSPVGDLSYFDYFACYDYVATDIFEATEATASTFEEYRNYIDRSISYLSQLKENFNARGIILGPETGISAAYESLKGSYLTYTKENIEENLIDILFEESLGRVDGYFFWFDWVSSPLSDSIKTYYTAENIEIKGLDVSSTPGFEEFLESSSM